MAPSHMDRLSALDVSFLTNETSSAHMHVGAVMIFEGPPPSYDDLAEHVRARLHLVPRFPQKPAHPPAPRARPSPPAGRSRLALSGRTFRLSTTNPPSATRRCQRRGRRSSCAAWSGG